jgi:hypothetical protein
MVSKSLLPFIIVSLSYILFTTSDGAIRMIVLLHAYEKSFSAMEVAIMFCLYELMGVVTNIVAGFCGSRWGIKLTLLGGLLIQLGGLGMLFGWKDSWSKLEAIIYITFAQMLCGIAKDLTKLGGKTVAKLVTPDDKQVQLFRFVSLLTGLKNSFKGVGYFIGAALLTVSYEAALGVFCGVVALPIPFVLFGLSEQLGRSSKRITFRDIFNVKHNVAVLSLARCFLFGSRDLWFEVPLPFFLRDAAQGMGWSRPAVGAFLACWIIIYGQVQSWCPQLVLGPLRQSPPNKLHSMVWVAVLSACPLFMGGFLQSEPTYDTLVVIIFIGLAGFALVFAVNSAIHSYLITKYCDGNKVAMDVGFYYMSNAAGRLTGTIVSGALYSYVGSSNYTGFAACFWVSAAFVALTLAITVFIRDDAGGLACVCTIIPPHPPPAPAPAPAPAPLEEAQPVASDAEDKKTPSGSHMESEV